MATSQQSDRELVYSQSTGALHYRQGDQVTRLGKGYSGHPPYVNQTTAEQLVAAGPIPRGRYRVGRPFRHVRLGRLAFFLEPYSGTDMFGRSGFFIHGDNEFGNQSASHGCIILPPSVREKLVEYAPITLVVA